MNRFRILFLLISASSMFASCSNYRSITPKTKTMDAREMATRIKVGKYYKILLTNENTAFIRVKKIEGTVIHGNLHLVNKISYPLMDSTGKKIGTHPGSVNLNDAVSIQKRKSTGVAIAVPVAAGVGFFLLLASLGPWTGD